MNTTSPKPAGTVARMAGRSPGLWAALFGLGMMIVAYLEYRDAIVMPWNLVLIALFALTLIPLGAAANNRAASRNVLSRAVTRYNKRAMIWSLGYVVSLGIAMTAYNSLDLEGPVLWALAILPALPILYMIWTMKQYLTDETDEFLRHKTIQASLFATGLLLAVATVWGFLEMFGAVPFVPSWAAIPLWAMGLGIGQFLQRNPQP